MVTSHALRGCRSGAINRPSSWRYGLFWQLEQPSQSQHVSRQMMASVASVGCQMLFLNIFLHGPDVFIKTIAIIEIYLQHRYKLPRVGQQFKLLSKITSFKTKNAGDSNYLNFEKP